MLCKHCGTEIADRALICFRCGAATTDPVFKPPATAGARSSSRNLIVSVLVLAVVVLVVLYLRGCLNVR